MHCGSSTTPRQKPTTWFFQLVDFLREPYVLAGYQLFYDNKQQEIPHNSFVETLKFARCCAIKRQPIRETIFIVLHDSNGTSLETLTLFLFAIQILFISNKARLLAASYKNLKPAEMNKWEKKAAQDKLRYQEEMKHYMPMEDPTGGGKKKKAKKDPNAPKRNMSAFFLYSCANRTAVKEQNPDASFGDIARLISAQFKALSDKERAQWDKKAAEDKTRYQQEMETFRA